MEWEKEFDERIGTVWVRNDKTKSFTTETNTVKNFIQRRLDKQKKEIIEEIKKKKKPLIDTVGKEGDYYYPNKEISIINETVEDIINNIK